MAYIQVTDNPVFPSQTNYQKINLTSNITLSWAVSFSSNTVLASVNKIIPDQSGWSITLDNATLAEEGTQLLFLNSTDYKFNIRKNDSTLIIEVQTGQAILLSLDDNSTPEGEWDVFPFGGEFNNIAAFEIASSDSSILVTDGTVAPPGGDVDIKITPSIANITAINDVGLVAITDTNPLKWGTTSLTGGSNISVTKDNIINLSSDVVGLTSLGVGNFNFTGSNLTTASPNQSINLTTEGTGVINLNGLNINSEGKLTSVFGINAFVCFNDNITGLTNTIVIEESSNVSSVTGGAGTYVINFIEPFLFTTYCVFPGFGSSGEPLPPSYDMTWITRDTTSVTISVKNKSGELVTDLPDSMGIIIVGGK